MAGEGRDQTWCCCLPTVERPDGSWLIRRCLARALDLDHCEEGVCPTYAECQQRVAADASDQTPGGAA